jgi:hypothetical protein
LDIQSSERGKGVDIVQESIERKKGKTTLLKLKKGLGVMRSVAMRHRQSMDNMMKEEE